MKCSVDIVDILQAKWRVKSNIQGRQDYLTTQIRFPRGEKAKHQLRILVSAGQNPGDSILSHALLGPGAAGRGAYGLDQVTPQVLVTVNEGEGLLGVAIRCW